MVMAQTKEEIIKFYVYPTMKSTYLYLGNIKNYKTMEECLKDPEIKDIAVHAFEEVSRALQMECGITGAEIDEYIKKVIEDINGSDCNEKITVMGTDIINNLKRDGSLVKSALLCRKHGMLPYYLAKIIASVFAFQNDTNKDAEEIRKFLTTNGIREGIKYFCQLNYEVELIQLIIDHYKKLLKSKFWGEDHLKVSKIKAAYEAGYKHEKNYRGCAQCTLAALFDVSEKEEQVLFRAANGFAAGMGLFGDGACGGYSGGILFMGTYAGRRLEHFDNDKEQKDKCYEMTKKLHDRFIETYGSVICEEIHKDIFGRAYHLRNSEDKVLFEEAGAHTKDKCTVVVATAAQWITEILIDDKFI